MSGNGTDDLLVAERCSKIFGGLVAVNDVSFSIPRKGIVSIIGPNGAGKTTFFNMLTGLYKPTTGRIAFDGDNITRVRPDLNTNAGQTGNGNALLRDAIKACGQHGGFHGVRIGSAVGEPELETSGVGDADHVGAVVAGVGHRVWRPGRA